MFCVMNEKKKKTVFHKKPPPEACVENVGCTVLQACSLRNPHNIPKTIGELH